MSRGTEVWCVFVSGPMDLLCVFWDEKVAEEYRADLESAPPGRRGQLRGGGVASGVPYR